MNALTYFEQDDVLKEVGLFSCFVFLQVAITASQNEDFSLEKAVKALDGIQSKLIDMESTGNPFAKLH